mmetsp:Transcript_11716/g.21963  ORF Transcript_11716/g.21963 Transcript_11716/m.21963 type:complete len:243 (+) Transcript_11716:2-730(+)
MANTNQIVVTALKYDKEWTNSDIGVTNPKFRQLVSWLEDTKIRLYKVEEREELRNCSSKTWAATFEKYLEALECPFDVTDNRVLNWLLNHALSLEYSDNASKLNAIEIKDSPGEKRAVTPVDQLFDDVNSSASNRIIGEMASKLNIAAGNLNGVKLLEKIEQVVASQTKSSLANGGTEVKVEDLPLGFSTGDENVDRASLVLRSLYIHDLRKLQTIIDETVVNVQEYTANPKTDAKLGRVGR